MIDVLTWLIGILPVVDWLAALILLGIALRYPTILTLRERAVAASVIALVATIGSLLAGARLGIFAIPNDVAILLLAIAIVGVSIPSVVWLGLLVTGRFRLPEEKG